ncbi:unnamed protein product [Linum tenue]|uniref:Uncharacterized protein n=1 Tax=Linum tenue TaxID=586396 RepID=A0AAV0RGF9_9ROSI|nr:unnamed protein product [Linum tenue]
MLNFLVSFCCWDLRYRVDLDKWRILELADRRCRST